MNPLIRWRFGIHHFPSYYPEVEVGEAIQVRMGLLMLVVYRGWVDYNYQTCNGFLLARIPWDTEEGGLLPVVMDRVHRTSRMQVNA